MPQEIEKSVCLCVFVSIKFSKSYLHVSCDLRQT